MTRTVVPPVIIGTRGGPADSLRSGSGDDFPTKLVKYIPGETLAFFVPTTAVLGPDRNALLVIVTVVAAAGNVGYLWWAATSEPTHRKPFWHFYVLAVLAFAAWALVTSPNLADLIGFDEVTSAVTLGIAVFLIPLIDSIVNRFRSGG